MSVVTKSGTGSASGGTFLSCAWHSGCGTQFHGSAFTNTLGARQEARAEGWLTAQPGDLWVYSFGRIIRLDYCPAHAEAERARRGKRRQAPDQSVAEPTRSGHDEGCADFYIEYGAPEGGVCKVCGDYTDQSIGGRDE